MSKLNFMIHCGGQHVERSDLVNPVLPPQTDSYTPVPHDYFVDLVQDELEGQGFRVTQEAHALALAGGTSYFGMMALKGGPVSNPDYELILGLRNSYNKRLSVGFAVGSQVFVCDNLSFTGDVVVRRKHTVNVLDDLRPLVFDAVSEITLQQLNQENRFDAYKGYTLSTLESDHLICEMFRNGVIGPQKISNVISEWDIPSHEEHSRYGRSAWRMFNAATEALKGSGLKFLPTRTRKLHDILDEVCEVDLMSELPEEM